MTNKRAILFDLDGTLVDSIDCYEDALRQALQEIGVGQFSHQDFLESYHLGQHLDHLLQKFERTDVDKAAVRARRDTIYLAQLRDRIAWITGAKELLEACQDRYTLGLITGSWNSYVNAIDERLQVREYFSTIVTCDDMGRFQKPHPHGILLACSQLNIEPHEAVYIGDQQFDIDAARAAGMEAHAVQGPLSPPKFMQAQYVHVNLHCLQDHLANLNEASN